jgi:hypothetical protein
MTREIYMHKNHRNPEVKGFGVVKIAATPHQIFLLQSVPRKEAVSCGFRG